jgi:hypothetical protein
MIPLNDVVKVYKSGNKDSWGIATTTPEATELKGMVVYSTKIEELKTAEGTVVSVTANITFKGKVDVEVNDEVGIIVGTEKKLKVLQVLPVNDLSGVTVFTKVVV